MKVSSIAPRIHFYSEGTSFVLPYKAKVRAWLAGLLIEAGYKLIALNYIFVTDKIILTLNKKRLNHNFYTDIITFPYHEAGDLNLHADIYISIERVLENAEMLNVSPIDELHRVMIHGILHMTGYDDHSEEDILEMREAENKALAGRGY